MKEFAFLIVMILIGALFVLIGYKIGSEIGKKLQSNSAFWIANILSFVGGIFLSALAIASGIAAATVSALGIIAGLIAGLKHGFGISSGPWKAHDKFFKLQPKQSDTDDKGEKTELISIASKDAQKYKK